MQKRAPLVRSADGKNYLLPFILITSLFFLWAFAHSLLDILNKHFRDLLEISRAKSALVQFAVYFGYFVMALPAGMFMKKFGYKKGIVFGLLLYALGAFLFFPATFFSREFIYYPFLFALFIIACGLAFLETAANPYSANLGPKESSEQRLNLSQSFNGLGWIVGPLIGSMLIFTGKTSGGNEFASLSVPYIWIGAIVLFVAVLFLLTPLPDITKDKSTLTDDSEAPVKLKKQRHFKQAVIAQFFYVAAQTGINSFFIIYAVDIFKELHTNGGPGAGLVAKLLDMVRNSTDASCLADIECTFNKLSGFVLGIVGMGLFWLGRVAGSMLMSWFKPNKLLSLFAAVNVILMVIVISGLGIYSVFAMCLCYFFMSIMFPTIFALGIKNLGPATQKASSYIVMAIVGGAVCPMLMGWIADNAGMNIGFIVPLLCFAVVMFYGWKGYKIREN
jgi:FHS family L-fucose permease-like MFS transporter